MTSSGDSSSSSVLFWAVVLASVAKGLYQKTQNDIKDLKLKLVKEKSLRSDERRGRIKLQQSQRGQIQQKERSDGYTMRPIGTVHSQYPDRRGTPRQPNLVRASRGKIVFDKQRIQAEHFKELGALHQRPAFVQLR